MRTCLLDRRSSALEPLTLTRAAFDLVCGMETLAAKLSRYFGASELGVVLRPALAPFYRAHFPYLRINDEAWLKQGPLVLVDGCWLPPPGMAPPSVVPEPEDCCVGLAEEEAVYVVVGPEQLRSFSLEALDDWLGRMTHELPCRAAGGRIIRYPWDLVRHNEEQIIDDYARWDRRAPGQHGAEIGVVGPRDRFAVDPSARIEPMVLVDTTRGPVVVAPHALVTAFTRLEGPCYIGPGTHVFGAKIRAGTTLGPMCRIGGEVECSIVHGHSNKYHEGFLGHAYLGAWVNLGAGTNNSDLRNDYGEVSAIIGGARQATGLAKVGCFIGDHTKTALGTLLNTGTSIGAFCHVLPAGRFAPKYMPSFTSWWNGAVAEAFSLEQHLETAARVLERRGYALSNAHVHLYRHLWQATAAERRRVLREQDVRPLRRSA